MYSMPSRSAGAHGPSDDQLFRLPPDWKIWPSVTPFSEVVDYTHTLYGLPDSWKTSRGKLKGGDPLIFGVCDTGVDFNHRDLTGQLVDAVDCTGSPVGPMDVQGHGTWCTGELVAVHGNDVGVAGICPDAKAVHAKVLADNGAGSERSIINGAKACVDRKARILSWSFGGGLMSPYMLGFIKELAQQGVIVFAASGNDAGPVNYPAKWADFLIPVGSVTKDGQLSVFTSKGPELRRGLLGPGESMLSCTPGSRYGEMTGTSMATPFVAGVAGLAYCKHDVLGGVTPLKNVDDMRKTLQARAGKVGEYLLVNPKGLLDDIGVPEKPPVTPITLIPGVHLYVPADPYDLGITFGDAEAREHVMQLLQVKQ